MKTHTRILAVAAVALLVPLAAWAQQAGPAKEPAKKAAPRGLQPGIHKIEEVLQKGLDQKAGGFNFTVLGEARTGSVELFQIDDVKPHFHPRENHFLYILKGKAKGQIGEVTAEVGPGDLVVIPAGKKFQHKLTKIGDEPVVFLLFSTPPFNAKDIVWMEK